MTSRVWSSPVISRSIHTSTAGTLPRRWRPGGRPMARWRSCSATPRRPSAGRSPSPASSSAPSCVAASGSWPSTVASSSGAPTVIATAAAEASGASLYVVTHPPPDPRTSRRRTSDAGSPSCSTTSSTTCPSSSRSTATAATACSRRSCSVGAIDELADTLGRQLAAALPDYQVVTDLPAIPRELRGLHPSNPVNVPPGGGVQLELPPRVRGLGPRWADWDGDGLVPPAAALVDVLARVARRGRRREAGTARAGPARRLPAPAAAAPPRRSSRCPIEGGTAVPPPPTTEAPAVVTGSTRRVDERRTDQPRTADRRVGRRPVRRRRHRDRERAERLHDDRVRPLLVQRSRAGHDRRRGVRGGARRRVVADEPVHQRARPAPARSSSTRTSRSSCSPSPVGRRACAEPPPADAAGAGVGGRPTSTSSTIPPRPGASPP